MDTYFLGTIMPFPYDFAPLGWAPCEGQLLPIAQNAALFSLIGTAYGGDGRTNFALPRLIGPTAYAVAGQGQGPGLSPRAMGEVLGSDEVTLVGPELPAHNHPMTLYKGAPGSAAPTAGATLVDPGLTGLMPPGTPPATSLSPMTVGYAGGGQPHGNDQPSLQLTYCIALQGLFPSFQ